MTGIMTDPMAEVSATAEPERFPKNMQATELTMESPPGSRPTKTLAKSTMRFARPPPEELPGHDEEGIARREKALIPWRICWATTTMGIWRYPSVARRRAPRRGPRGSAG